LQSIPYDVVKSCLAIFLNEVLYKAVKQQSSDERLFDFVFNAIEWLDHQTAGVVNFHLFFLLRLTRFLGFYPDTNLAATAGYFNLRDGVFCNTKPDGMLYLAPPHTQNFLALLQSSFENICLLKISHDERRYLLQRLLDYYELHIEGFGNIRSHEVLEEVLG
jgi:DNA repair protein RecO (recombination protein O)